MRLLPPRANTLALGALRQARICARRLRRDSRSGNSAVEFALLFPVLVTIMLGLLDASNALIVYRRLTSAAEEVALIATELSVQNDGTTSLTPYNVYQAGTAIFGVFPGLRGSGSAQPFTVLVSVVYFIASPNPCTPGASTPHPACTYTPYVAWSVPLSEFAGTYATPPQYLGTTPASKRACGTVAQVAQTTAATLTTIPTQGMTSLTSVLVVDATYTFTPLFTRVFLGAQTFMHTALLPPRLGGGAVPYTVNAGNYITYDLANLADADICPSPGAGLGSFQ